MEIFRSAGLIVREARFPRLDRVGMETFGMMAEMAVAHEERFRDYSDRYGARLRSTVKAAAQVPGKDVARAYLARDRFAGEVNTAFRSIDMLLTPALPEPAPLRSEEHTSELQSLMRISYAVFCLKKKRLHKQLVTSIR